MTSSINFPITADEIEYEATTFRDAHGDSVADALIADTLNAQHAEINDLRAQVAALTPTEAQTERRELGELSLRMVEADEKKWDNGKDQMRQWAIWRKARDAYLAVRYAAKETENNHDHKNRMEDRS